MDNKIQLDFIPDKKILRVISKTGSSFKDAFSEMIDNSLDSFKTIKSKADNTFVTVSIQFSLAGQEGRFKYKNGSGEDYDIEVWDDAAGMSEDEFKRCLKLAYVDEKKIKKGSIRRYGVGLKTSLLSLGKKFKIMSRPFGSKKIYSLIYDDDYFVENSSQNWDSLYFTVEDDDPNFPKHGTVIKVKKRDDLLIYPVKISQMKSYFRIQYGNFLEETKNKTRELKLIINKDEVSAYPLELISFNNTEKHEFSFKLSSGKKIIGWYGFYKKGAKRGQVEGFYGFDLIWQRRIIERYSKVGIRTHPEYQRIYGQIHLDGLEVDFHKTKFIEDSEDYVDFDFNMNYLLNGPKYDDAKKYFTLKSGDTKTLVQLDNERNQLSDLFLFFEYIKKSRDLRREITEIKTSLTSEDILPIPLDKLEDLDTKLYFETIPLDNLPEQEKILKKLEDDLVLQREKRAEEKEYNEQKNKDASSSEHQRDGKRTENSDAYKKNPHAFDGWSIYYKKCKSEEADFIVVRDKTRNIFKYLNRNHKEIILSDYFKEQD